MYVANFWGDTIFVTNFGGASVSVIDAATMTTVATIPVGGQPAGLVLTRDGTRAYVTEPTLHVIDTVTNTEVGVLSVGTTPLYVGARCVHGPDPCLYESQMLTYSGAREIGIACGWRLQSPRSSLVSCGHAAARWD
jgi:YVTN family beta-propeller protein